MFRVTNKNPETYLFMTTGFYLPAERKKDIGYCWTVAIAVLVVAVGYALQGDLSMSNVANTLSNVAILSNVADTLSAPLGYIVTSHTIMRSIPLFTKYQLSVNEIVPVMNQWELAAKKFEGYSEICAVWN